MNTNIDSCLPYKNFLVMNCQQQKTYYLQYLKLVNPSLINFIDDITLVEKASLLKRARAFKKLEALVYCGGDLLAEAQSYNKFRTKKKTKDGKFSSVTKDKPSVLRKRAILHLDDAIEALYSLTGNMHNIKILKSIIVEIPPLKETYYTDVTENTTIILKSAGFGPRIRKRILNILKPLNKS